MIIRNPESPFSTLISRLLSTQDDLLSSRADQKTLLLSLVANLRAELAASERALDTAEQQKLSAYDQLRKATEQHEQDRLDQQKLLQEAVRSMETAQDSLTAEIARRETALREEMLHEKAKREIAESQLDQIKRESESEEELHHLRSRLQQEEQRLGELQRQNESIQQETRVKVVAHEESRARHAKEVETLQRDLRASDDHIRSLEEQLSAAEMQIARSSTQSDQQIASLEADLREALARNATLECKLGDTTHALEHERFEQARQADYTASIQEDMQQEHDRLQNSVARLEQDRSTTHRELVSIKADSTRLLQQREDRISQLEEEVLNRSAERRQLAAAGCPDCAEAHSRTDFLEKEIIRMREQLGKMRMESADREVKVARLVKARDQLREDVDGLNIALEAKQQEVHLLKRASVEIPGTVRRPTRSRPSSTHEAGKTETATRIRPVSHRFSIHNASTLETPSITGAVLSSAATSDRPTSILGARRPLSRMQNKAYEAASLVPASEQEKENTKSVSIGKKMASLPDAPKHPMTASPAKRQAMHAS